MPKTLCADFICRDQLRENALLKKFYCDVDIKDLINFNEELAHRLVSEPAEIIPLVSASYSRVEGT
jgi:DNA replication licensing factor MCM5